MKNWNLDQYDCVVRNFTLTEPVPESELPEDRGVRGDLTIGNRAKSYGIELPGLEGTIIEPKAEIILTCILNESPPFLPHFFT